MRTDDATRLDVQGRAAVYAAALAQLRADEQAALLYRLTTAPHPRDPYPVLSRAGVLK